MTRSSKSSLSAGRGSRSGSAMGSKGWKLAGGLAQKAKRSRKPTATGVPPASGRLVVLSSMRAHTRLPQEPAPDARTRNWPKVDSAGVAFSPTMRHTYRRLPPFSKKPLTVYGMNLLSPKVPPYQRWYSL